MLVLLLGHESLRLQGPDGYPASQLAWDWIDALMIGGLHNLGARAVAALLETEWGALISQADCIQNERNVSVSESGSRGLALAGCDWLSSIQVCTCAVGWAGNTIESLQTHRLEASSCA